MQSTLGKAIHRYFLVHAPFYQSSLDKKFKWVPFATVGVLKLFGVKTTSGWMRQILLAATTETIRYLVTDNLKKLTSNQRPFPYTGHHSFPSGDTSSSFAGAEFMHAELKKTLPVLSCAGYGAGIVTGTIRLMKNRHWLKDVVAGALIGLASAKLAYFIVDKLSSKRKKQQPEMETGPLIAEPVKLISERIKRPAL